MEVDWSGLINQRRLDTLLERLVQLNKFETKQEEERLQRRLQLVEKSCCQINRLSVFLLLGSYLCLHWDAFWRINRSYSIHQNIDSTYCVAEKNVIFQHNILQGRYIDSQSKHVNIQIANVNNQGLSNIDGMDSINGKQQPESKLGFRIHRIVMGQQELNNSISTEEKKEDDQIIKDINEQSNTQQIHKNQRISQKIRRNPARTSPIRSRSITQKIAEQAKRSISAKYGLEQLNQVNMQSSSGNSIGDSESILKQTTKLLDSNQLGVNSDGCQSSWLGNRDSEREIRDLDFLLDYIRKLAPARDQGDLKPERIMAIAATLTMAFTVS
ncbi:MAG: hypothetical protein EZS28_006473 [Streblomastix strix]|uniref:Uncharacterized protein n=1 Tax=Streblomastix strix TaxID=222440 RepID=A0A5J4WUY5_9EUKA|nr:MAG: hypothetical protein EZS28_006473 [Streblomastix strix]